MFWPSVQVLTTRSGRLSKKGRWKYYKWVSQPLASSTFCLLGSLEEHILLPYRKPLLNYPPKIVICPTSLSPQQPFDKYFLGVIRKYEIVGWLTCLSHQDSVSILKLLDSIFLAICVKMVNIVLSTLKFNSSSKQFQRIRTSIIISISEMRKADAHRARIIELRIKHGLLEPRVDAQ